MIESVSKILENTRVNSDYHTHVSMIQPIGKYNIPKQMMDNFWDKYCEEIEQSNFNKKHYGIAEKPHVYLPIIVDIDLKLKCDEKDYDSLYTDAQLENSVRNYQEVINTIIDKCMPKHLICFVFEKKPYKKMYGQNEYIKHGFHLAFPNVFLSKNDHENYLLQRVKKLFSKDKIFANIVDDSADVIDTCYLKNPWLLYGSKKSENMEPYKLTRIFNNERQNISLEVALKDYEIYDAKESLININNNYNFYLPRVLSIIIWHRKPCEIKPTLPSIIKISEPSGDVLKREYKIRNMNENLERVRALLKIISEDRAEHYSEWMQIGWALYNISNGSEDGLSLWLEFSERCPEKFDESACVSAWNKMEKRNITIGTLAFYAKEDNPLEFSKIIDLGMDQCLSQCIKTGSHNDLARVMFEKYGTVFVCSSIKDSIWYQYEDHRWRKIEDGVSLRKKLSDELCQKIAEKDSENSNTRLAQCQNDGERIMILQSQKQTQTLICKLKSSTFKSAVMKEMKDVFYSENFTKLLNKNNWLIGFKNGVYDLKTNIFRSGIPEDYISMQIPHSYSEYSETDHLVKQIEDFLEKIFPDKTLLNYFLDIMSDIFVGGNQKKHVYVWSGEGNNGKSVTQTFFEKMLGEYAIKLPTSLLIGKRTASAGASPELIRAAGGVRWAVLQEPDKKDVINNGILKELSGNDTIYARGLYQGGEEFEPSFKLALICNEPPTIMGDKAVWNRIRIIPFESTFTDNAPESWEEQLLEKKFPNDPFFAEKIPLLVKPFMWYLLNHRKKPRKFIEPEKVKIATNIYKKKNDLFLQFVDERIVNDDKSSITLQELYINFKDWFKESMPGMTIPIKSDLKDYFYKLWGSPLSDKGGTWKGKKAITLEMEVETGTAIVISSKDLVQK
jgi:P4 family phage/plasmid primase-like protien